MRDPLPFNDAKNNLRRNTAFSLAFLPNCWNNDFYDFPGKSRPGKDDQHVWQAITTCDRELKNPYLDYRFHRLRSPFYEKIRQATLETLDRAAVPRATAEKVIADMEQSVDLAIESHLPKSTRPVASSDDTSSKPAP